MTTTWLRPAFLMALLLTASCSLVPDYTRPDIGVAQSWDGAAFATGAAPQGAWWQSFQNGELSTLVETGLQTSPSLTAAIARIEQARGAAETAGGLLYPQLTGGVTQATQRGLGSKSTQQLLVQASYEVDLFGRVRATAKSADALAQASAFDADTAAMTLAANIVDSYFLYLSLSDRIALAQSIADDARHLLSLIELQRAAGAATDLQIEQQRALVAGFEAAVPALQQQRAAALHALAVFSGRAPEGFRVHTKSMSDIGRPIVDAGVPSALLERRPDIRAAESRLIAANFDVGAARAAFYPTISLSALIGAGAKNAAALGAPSAISGFGATLLQPILDGGVLAGQLRTSKARALEYVATYRQTVLIALQETEDALSGIDQISKAAGIQAQAERAAQRAADLAKLQYRLGSADYLNVLTTEQTLYQAQDALLQLRLQHLQQIVALFRALGGGFNAPGGPRMTSNPGA